MNQLAHPVTTPALWQSLAALLRVGVHSFWLQCLPPGSGLPTLLLQEAQTLLPGGTSLDWHTLSEQVAAQWPSARGVLANLVSDLQLGLHEALLLTLLGEVERSHLITLTVAELQAPANHARPTVHLCAALLDSLFGPGTLPPLRLMDSPLLQSRLITLEGDGPLPLRTLHMAPGYWSVLLEQAQGWPQCQWLPDGDFELLPQLARRQLPVIAGLLAEGAARGVILRGTPNSGRRLFAYALAQQLGRKAMTIPTELWQKEPALALACRYGGWLPVLQPTLGPGEVWRPGSLPERLPVVILLASDGAVEGRDLIELPMPLPDAAERRRLWGKYLGSDELSSHASNAQLSGSSIVTLAASARLLAQRQQQALALHHLTQARRQLGAERLRLLAQPVEREVHADAIVLPPLVNEELDRLIARAEQRESLWQGLGATLAQTTTPGLRALFVGESGTGKTLAASYLATRLGAPLYRVDLSAVMNKYIGESEKNLSAVLDMAATSDVILLFDEADSLFGRRSEGKETGERFANMLTHFLLTRIENHPGIVVLTSNNRERIDAAFTRRLDMIVEFPLPGFAERLDLWRSHLGERGPGETVYCLLASYCTFAGGQLRNVVITAAACAGDGPITSAHLLKGLLAEYRKLGRDMPGKLEQIDSKPAAEHA